MCKVLRFSFLTIVGISIIFAFGISELLSALDSTYERESEGALSRPIRNPEKWPRIDGSFKNIFWVVQISDIHISLYIDPKRGPDLLELCQNYIKLINPETVLVTGDLTDAKGKGRLDSMQIREEWVIYQNVVKKCSAMTRAKWIDIRGNHDCFDVYNSSSSNNYYRWFSATGPVHERKNKLEEGFIHSVDFPFGSYSFIGMDTCSRPGPNRPFNFFGYMSEKQKKHLKYLSAVASTSNHTVWFGHFPTSLIVQNSPTLREIMRGSIMYLCGHLHTLANLVPHMYARQKTGQLELELGDWKENRVFRVIAFDNDLVSFVDAKFGNQPIVLITNPKNKDHLSPSLEPVEMIASSSYIRILIFSPKAVKQVIVHIDNRYLGNAIPSHPDSPLYVLKWNAKMFSEGDHKLLVIVLTADKNTTLVTQHFSMDGKEGDFKLLPRLILMLNIYTVGKVVFGVLVFLYIIVLSSLRQCSNIRMFFFRGMFLRKVYANKLLIKIWLVSRISSLYYLLVGSVLYLAFGPWFVAHLLSDHIGVVFVWGIVINNTFLPGGLTYFYGIFQVMVFTVPVTLILGHILEKRRKFCNKFVIIRHIPFAAFTSLLFLFTAYLAFGEFRWAYGHLALPLGPLRTGNLILLPIAIGLALRADLKEIMADTGHF
ncbi:transmembrane protein 62 [Plakobranchus ocellatus]|uniref:Transmembrane protein 62 n=1 Tax=Plakobranchus ocellatus TaxID=259542 RepID=A0AAV3YIL1_9GAST|nr:transmembrane protein 62 [Plakobranchus ocellatus]